MSVLRAVQVQRVHLCIQLGHRREETWYGVHVHNGSASLHATFCSSRMNISSTQHVIQMQRFYFDAAYWEYQLAELGKLDATVVARARERRVTGRKRQRQEHFEYAEKLRQHCADRNLTKPSSKVSKERARQHDERVAATKRQAISRGNRRQGQSQSQQASQQSIQEETDDVFELMPRIHWPAETAPMLWNSHALPPGLRPPTRSASEAQAAENTSDSNDDDAETIDHDVIAREYAAKVHAQWLSQSTERDIQEIVTGKTWSVRNVEVEDKWSYTGHMLAQNISYSTLLKSNFLFVIGKSYRRLGYKTLMCKVSTQLTGRKQIIASPATYNASVDQLVRDAPLYNNTLWQGSKRRTATKRSNECEVRIRLHLDHLHSWTCYFKQQTHLHGATAAAAPVVIPQAMAEAITSTHRAAVLTSTQAARMCANNSTFIPRDTLRRLLKTDVDDESWGHGGQEGFLLELMADPAVDICAQFVKRSANRIHATVTVARLEGVWKIVDGGLQKARREYVAMVLTLQRLKFLWARTRNADFVDRIAAAEVALQERLRPCVDEQENGIL